jgi:hypothetical protein
MAGFYDKIYTALLDAAHRHGAANPEALARLGAAQSSVETGGGKHAPGNNYFGIKGGGGGNYSTQEVINGRRVTIHDNFRGYPSMQASADDYIKFLHKNPRYQGVVNAKTPEEAIRAQSRSGYATDPQYGQKLSAVHSSQGGSTPPNNPNARSNFGVAAGSARDGIMHRGGPAPVASAPATAEQASKPVLQPMSYKAPEGAEKFQNSMPAAQRESVLTRINPKDPSGPLMPAPVTAQAATPQQISQPKIEPRTVSTLPELGMRPWAGGVSAPIQRDMTTNFPMRGQRDMMGDTPYAVGMAGSQEYLNQPQAQPEMRPLGTPIDPQPAPLVPIAPAAPAATTPPPAPVETTTPSAPADTTPPGPEAPATPSDTTPSEGGGGGNMLAGLMDALSNLGGGGEGGGAQQPANPAPQAAPIYMPDMPSQSAPFDMQLAQKGQLADQPVQGISNLAQLFDVKPIGQAPAIQQQNMGQANLATKRLFG